MKEETIREKLCAILALELCLKEVKDLTDSYTREYKKHPLCSSKREINRIPISGLTMSAKVITNKINAMRRLIRDN